MIISVQTKSKGILNDDTQYVEQYTEKIKKAYIFKYRAEWE